jgi:hypothetical protein
MSQAFSDFAILSADSLDSDDESLIGRQKLPIALADDSSAQAASGARNAFVVGGTDFVQFHSTLDHAISADSAIAPPHADPSLAPAIETGASHFAPQTDLEPWPAVFDLTTLDGTNGFQFGGTGTGTVTLSHVDINGDGFSDLLVGANIRFPDTNSPGENLIVYGKEGAFPAAITSAFLDGTNGFATLARDFEGQGFSSAGVGDVNGDGFDDLIVATDSNRYGMNGCVLFGRPTFGAFVNVTQGNGTKGFAIGGLDTYLANVAAAGDINGDGFADVIIGHAVGDNFNQHNFVVFGHAGSFPANFDLSTVDGTNGFKTSGVGTGFDGDRNGAAFSSAGDVNGDGISDVIFGAYGDNSFTGAAYVIFGHTGSFSANIDFAALNGSDGFKLTGPSTYDFAGRIVASLGDVNGDGFADIAISDGRTAATENVYVVFGHGGSFTANFDLTTLSGSNGFKLTGAGAAAPSAGDVNGDGFNDIIVGNSGGYAGLSGNAYVIFGKASGFSATFDVSTLDGTNGFRIAGETTGPNANNNTGSVVSSAGDLNGDGFADLIVAGSGTSVNHDTSVSYVIYGRLPDASVNRTGTAASQTLAGGNFDDILSGLGGNDDLYGNGGNDTLTGGTGADSYHFSSTGPANVDTVTDYSFSDGDKIDLSGLVDAHAVSAVNLSDYVRVVVSGSDLTVQADTDGTATGVTWADVAVLTGDAASLVTLQIGAQTILLAGSGNDTVTAPSGVTPKLFDLSGGGDDTATGGPGNDGFSFAAAYTPADHVDGGGGTNDQIALQGDYSAGVTLSGSSIANVEVMALLPGFSYNFTTTDDLVAGGQSLTFWAINLTGSDHATINGSAETDGTFNFYLGQGNDTAIGGAGADLFYGEGGADTLTGNGGADVFASRVVTDSTGANYDTITDFTAGTDKFDLPVAVSAIDATVAAGALSTASFDTDLATAVNAGHLAIHHAVLFTPDTGTLATHTFLIVDTNGTAGYQAGADYVFDVTGGSLGGLAAGDFI